MTIREVFNKFYSNYTLSIIAKTDEYSGDVYDKIIEVIEVLGEDKPEEFGISKLYLKDDTIVLIDIKDYIFLTPNNKDSFIERANLIGVHIEDCPKIGEEIVI